MLDNATVIKAWRDPEFRVDLTSEQRAALPSHPAGIVEISDTEMESAAGATTYFCFLTFSYCITEAMSCYGSCDNTYFDGTCNMFSIGCCI